MKTTLPVCALIALLLSAPVRASDAVATAETASPHTFSANIGVFSQYIFRGVSQTNEDPALQGGFDYAHSSGLYLGTWASNVSWLRENFSPDYPIYSSGGRAEVDFYGGYKNTFGETGIGYDVGLLYYWYPGQHLPNYLADTLEAYGALSWKWFTAKYSYSLLSRTFAVPQSDGTWYLDLAAAVPLGETGLTAGVHWGRQDFAGAGNGIYSYNDWRLSLAYDLGKLGEKLAGTEAGVMYTDNTTKSESWPAAVFGGRNQFTGYLKRTF